MKTLDFTEKQVLLRKYMHNPYNPLSFEKAVIKVDEFHNKMKDLNKQLKASGKTEDQRNNIFRQEFEKLCQEFEQ